MLYRRGGMTRIESDGKPYIHYIAVKEMNNVSRKSLDWHPYKTAVIPDLPYNDMFIIRYGRCYYKNYVTDERLLLLQQSWILASVHSKDVKHGDCVKQYFRRENNKELTVQCVLMWPALFLLITTLLGNVASGLKWRRLRQYSPSPQRTVYSGRFTI